MKKGIIFFAFMFVAITCFAETEYTYEKVDNDVVKIVEIETTQRISTTNITIENLRVKVANLEGVKDNALTYYTETTQKIDEEIAFIETQIGKAKELGVTESILELK